MKAVILGTTGYTGLMLLRSLAEHPEISEIIPVSSSIAGTSVFKMDPGLSPKAKEKMTLCGSLLVTSDEAAAIGADVVFAALPHLKSAELCAPYFDNSVVIDLSADFRIKDPVQFHKAYKQAPPRPDLLEKAVYGLCEWSRDEVKHANLIANPGCYPTATLLPLLPLAKEGLISGQVVVNALSGISGAGKKAQTNTLFCERSENTNAYAPGRTHRHTIEIQKEIDYRNNELDILFTPHLVPLKRGMFVTTTVKSKSPMKAADLEALYTKYYGSELFVNLQGQRIPETRDVRGSNRCDIGWHVEENKDGSTTLQLFSVIDNVIKGASGQAVQNMNIRFGFEENLGLALSGDF